MNLQKYENVPIITIDGPSGSGKGTLSKRLAKVLNWNLLDSGIIYRILAEKALENRVNINNEKQLVLLACTIKIDFLFKNNKFFVLINGKNIKKSVYTEIIGNIASKIAILPKVREVLLRYQRIFCQSPGLIADGRDMGTVVFPHAILKIFLQASLKERENRRLHQLYEKKIDTNYNFLEKIKERDCRDYYRKLSPMIPAIDAWILDSTYLSAEEVYNQVRMYIIDNIVLPPKSLYNIIYYQG